MIILHLIPLWPLTGIQIEECGRKIRILVDGPLFFWRSGVGGGWGWKTLWLLSWLTKSGLLVTRGFSRADFVWTRARCYGYDVICSQSSEIPVCHESKLHTKWLLSVSRKERVWWNRATTTCDLTQKRLVDPLHRDLVHSFRRYEPAWFVIAGDMPFPCLCRCKMQSFRNDARRETHDEVCLFVGVLGMLFAL